VIRDLENEMEMEDDESLVDSDEEEWEGGEREYVEDSDAESDVGDLEDYSGSEVSRIMILLVPSGMTRHRVYAFRHFSVATKLWSPCTDYPV
jgi:hypothetical protein